MHVYSSVWYTNVCTSFVHRTLYISQSIGSDPLPPLPHDIPNNYNSNSNGNGSTDTANNTTQRTHIHTHIDRARQTDTSHTFARCTGCISLFCNSIKTRYEQQFVLLLFVLRCCCYWCHNCCSCYWPTPSPLPSLLLVSASCG